MSHTVMFHKTRNDGLCVYHVYHRIPAEREGKVRPGVVLGKSAAPFIVAVPARLKEKTFGNVRLT
jgi:hypothetical protein